MNTETKSELRVKIAEQEETIRKLRCWANYGYWAEENYEFNDYADKYYKKVDGQVLPFSSEYTEMDIRKEYIKLNNL